VGNLGDKKVLFIILIASLTILIAGLASEPYVGDEVYHYHFAKNIYTAGKRVSFDPLYSSGNPPGFFYATDPLWNGLLAVLWRLWGGISFPIAQIYHTCFYALLLIFTYLIGKNIFGERVGVWSCLLMASVPMAVAFGILFYVDVPATAITMVAFYWIIRKKYLWAGLVFPLMYLTKRNACFLIPAMILIPLFLERERFFLKLKGLIYLLMPFGIIVLWDMQWRHQHIESTKFQIKGVGTIRHITLLENIRWRVTTLFRGSKEYLNSSLVNPPDLIKYLGVALILLVIFYLVRGLFKQETKKAKTLIWGAIGSYFLFFLLIFGFNSDIRYLFPILPLLSLEASKAIISFQRRWVSVLIFGICLTQFGSTLAYVYVQRQMPKGIKEGFSYIQNDIPKNALLMYPEYSLLEATGRRFVWSSFFEVEDRILRNRYPRYKKWDMSRNFFWNNKKEDLERSLEASGVDYIVIKKSRIYDDRKVKHLGGYPRSFIQRMPTFPFLKLIFENTEISIWKVQKEPLPSDKKYPIN
jgi:4-amino-4-deoxy-L-arabinose transferase-like glycosyltransferase